MTHFHKVSGSGNDFLALAEPFEIPQPETIRAWCRRGVSLGADGLFVLRRAEGGATMDYFNADGFPADLCLNGTRCAAQLAFHLGWAKQRVVIETPAGRVDAEQLTDSLILLELPPPPEPDRTVTVEALGQSLTGWAIKVGVPHFVIVWPESLARVPVVELGRAVRHDGAFGEAGTNVNFVRFPEPDRMEIRTYERGVEDETLSCGSGIMAGAAVGLAAGQARLPMRVATRGGFELQVAGGRAAGRWSLVGDARIVAEGEMLPGAMADLEPYQTAGDILARRSEREGLR
jgi:diaminopimelate epimerase